MIKLRLIQCIWTILLVLVSAIGYFIVSPMPAKATDLCGQPPALEELLMGSYLQKDYVSTQVKVIEGNITNSFLISQEEEAPPSKQERGKDGYRGGIEEEKKLKFGGVEYLFDITGAKYQKNCGKEGKGEPTFKD